MSSEGSETLSTLSKIRQFGLYRTVDARTEEFLRLSKKRQIKQGCACAAISTAITVTIVVVILLIYEYIATSYATEESQSDIKYFQIIMNNTIRSKPNNEISSNEKFGLDRRTLNILQILLNSLKHNELLDTIIKESYVTSTSVTTDNLKNNEHSTNVVTRDNKQLDSLESKHIPIYLLKNIKKKNINSNRFARKIEKNKEHKRLLDYFYKMINGRFDNKYPRKHEDHLNKNVDHTFNDIFSSYNKKKTYSTTTTTSTTKSTNTEKQIKSMCICPTFFQNALKNFTRHIINIMNSYKTERKEAESQIEKNNLTNISWNNISSAYIKSTKTVQNNTNNSSEILKIQTQTYLPTLETISNISLRDNLFLPNNLSNYKNISNSPKSELSTEYSKHFNKVNTDFKYAQTELSTTNITKILPGNILENVSTVKNVNISLNLNNATEIYSSGDTINNIVKFEKVSSHLNTSKIKSNKEINNLTSNSSTFGKDIYNNPNLEIEQNSMETISLGRNKPLLTSKYHEKIILTYHNKMENGFPLKNDKNSTRENINFYSNSEENSGEINYKTFINNFKNINSLGQILYLKDELINKYYTTESPSTVESQNNFYYNFFNNLVKMNNTSNESDIIDNEVISFKSNSIKQHEKNDDKETNQSYGFRNIFKTSNEKNPTKIKILAHNTSRTNYYPIQDYLSINNEKNDNPKSMPIDGTISSTQIPDVYYLRNLLMPNDANIEFDDYMSINNKIMDKPQSFVIEDIFSSTQIPPNVLMPDNNNDFVHKDILKTQNDIVNFMQPNSGLDEKNEDFVDVNEWIAENYDDILSFNISNYDYIDTSEQSITKTTPNEFPIANINRIEYEANKFKNIVNNSPNTLYSQVPITQINKIENASNIFNITVNNPPKTLYSLYKQVPITQINSFKNASNDNDIIVNKENKQDPITNINQMKNETNKFDNIINNLTNTLYLSHYKQFPINNIHRINNESKKFDSTVNKANKKLNSHSILQFLKNESINQFSHDNKASNINNAHQIRTIKNNISSKYANNYKNKGDKNYRHLNDEAIEQDSLYLKSDNFIDYDEISSNIIVSTTSKSTADPSKIENSGMNLYEYHNKTQTSSKSTLLESSEPFYNNETFQQLSPNNDEVKYSKKDTMNDILYKKPSFLIIKQNEWWKDNDISDSDTDKYYR